MQECIEGLNEYLRGWIGFFRICTRAQSTLLHLDAHIRRRLRAIVLRHWRRRRTIVRRLVRLGVSREGARRGIYGARRSWWALSHSPVVERALRNAYFAERGLVSLFHPWREPHVSGVAVVPVQRPLDFG